MSVRVSYGIRLANDFPMGYSGTLDWAKSLRGRKSLGIPVSPWTVTPDSPDSITSFSAVMEMESASVESVRVRAVPRSECGWALDRWFIRYGNGGEIISTEERPAGGRFETDVEVRPVIIGNSYFGYTEVYPYFTFHGTGRLLATPAGGALLGRMEAGFMSPRLIIDL